MRDQASGDHMSQPAGAVRDQASDDQHHMSQPAGAVRDQAPDDHMSQPAGADVYFAGATDPLT